MGRASVALVLAIVSLLLSNAVGQQQVEADAQVTVANAEDAAPISSEGAGSGGGVGSGHPEASQRTDTGTGADQQQIQQQHGQPQGDPAGYAASTRTDDGAQTTQLAHEQAQHSTPHVDVEGANAQERHSVEGAAPDPARQAIRQEVEERDVQHAAAQAQQAATQQQAAPGTVHAEAKQELAQAGGEAAVTQQVEAGASSTELHKSSEAVRSTVASSEAQAIQNLEGEAAAGKEQVTGSQQDEHGAATQVAAAPPQHPPPPPAPPAYVLPAGVTVEDVNKMLKRVEASVWGNTSTRNLQMGLQSLMTLASILDDAVPTTGSKTVPRRVIRTPPPPPASPAEAPAVAVADGAATTSKGTAAAVSPPAPPAKPQKLSQRMQGYRNTGADVAARGVFALAAFEAAGVLPASYHTTPGAYLIRLHQAAQAGSTEALLALADRFFQGHGVVKNCERGVHFAHLAAGAIVLDAEKEMRYNPPTLPLDLRERHMDARYVAADDLENAPHVINMEEDMAQRGNPEAQRRMAYRRLVGRGIEADPEAAFADFQVGAAQGDAFAMFNLGYMHLRGWAPGKEVNYTEARKWFEVSAEKGMAAGWNGLGVLYWNGHGGPQNLTAAHEAFLKGAAMNHSESLYNLGLMESNGIGVPKNETAGAEYYKLADRHGHWRAAFNLAVVHGTGAGVPRDCGKAEEYYRKFFRERSAWPKAMTAAAAALEEGDNWGALLQYILLAEQGNGNAAVNAGWMLRHGLGYAGPRYLDMAMQFFERAAAQNHTAGLLELGHMLMDADGLGVSRASNITAAVSLWARAAEDNHTESLYLMGWAHQHGVGLPHPNRTKAAQLYYRAIESAGKACARGAAPRAALIGMGLDWVLSPFVGPDATTRLVRWVRSLMRVEVVKHRGYMPQETGGVGEVARLEIGVQGQRGAGEGEAEGEERLVQGGRAHKRGSSMQDGGGEGWELALQQAQDTLHYVFIALGMDRVEVDTIVMTALLGALALVLWARQRQLIAAHAARAAQHPQEEVHQQELS